MALCPWCTRRRSVANMSHEPQLDLQREMSPDIFEHCPFSDLRAAQVEVLNRLKQWLGGTKKFMVVQVPTGGGKSGIAAAAASYIKRLFRCTCGAGQQNRCTCEYQPGAYILLPQIALTAQYMSDFKQNGLVELKGAANYKCRAFDNVTCDAASKMHGPPSPPQDSDDTEDADSDAPQDPGEHERLCQDYVEARREFKESRAEIALLESRAEIALLEARA
jgi:hypothetical protein